MSKVKAQEASSENPCSDRQTDRYFLAITSLADKIVSSLWTATRTLNPFTRAAPSCHHHSPSQPLERMTLWGRCHTGEDGHPGEGVTAGRVFALGRVSH